MQQQRNRRARVIPFGWRAGEEDDILEPVQIELDALEMARKYYASGEYGLRTLAKWVSENTGRKISHTGLEKAMERDERERGQEQ